MSKNDVLEKSTITLEEYRQLGDNAPNTLDADLPWLPMAPTFRQPSTDEYAPLRQNVRTILGLHQRELDPRDML